MNRYNPKEIEPKWQQVWDDQGIYKVDFNSPKPKFTGFGMFNYPSGAGIHIGHGKNFTLPDILVRARRQQGYESYMPVGFDSFGLPAENYAIKTGTSPRITTDNAIANFRRQYRAMGWSMDWSKEIDTSHPEYYRWTQWIFVKLFEAGLAYQKESPQWWCDIDQTVLANEQVINGKCWRHDGPDDPQVSKKNLKQWFYRITEYIDEILDATDSLDWTESVKTMQKNWIGKSEGTVVTFDLAGLGADVQQLSIYTTAVETIYGATFMVLAPEHPLIVEFGQLADNAEDISEYVQKAARKSELDREIEKDKTGVPVEGLTAIHPLTGLSVPVWIADYVMMGYGSGAIMAVPGEDSRDYAFANKFGLPIIYTTDRGEFTDYAELIKPNKSAFNLANSGEFDGQDFVTGRDAIIQKLLKDGRGEQKTHFKMRDWLISRQRYWGAPIPIIHCPKDGAVSVPETQLPVLLPEVEDYKPTDGSTSVLATVEEWVNVECPTCGGPARRETDTQDGYACSSWYFLRFMDPHNDSAAWNPEVANKWMPVDFYNGGDHATAHLLYARFFMRFFYKQGLVDKPEPFQKMYYHAKIMAPDGTAFSKSKGNGVDPLSIIESGYGADAVRTYIMFISPADLESPWSDDGVPGCYRFLNRIHTLVQEYLEADGHGSGTEDKDNLRIIHKTIKKVSEDIEQIKFNTAIAAMMESVNELYKIKATRGYASSSWKTALEGMVQIVAPFAPHLAEELWHQLGHEDTVHVDHWPSYDETLLVRDEITLAVQVNGKVRTEITIAADASKEVVIAAGLADENVQKHLQNKDPAKTIYIPGRILNFVT